MPDRTPIDHMPGEPGQVTKLLIDWRSGDSAALERLTPIIYEDLMRVAKARIRAESRDCTLQPTALVHEAYLRLVNETGLPCECRAHFYAVASNIMRRVLIDYARKRKAHKRGAGLKITLKTGMDFAGEQEPDSLVLDDALRKLAEFDTRKAQAIELKYFGGLTTEEISTALGISVATVGRELRMGQAWLRRELARALA
jgi:RNA polymerase sigma-70 factor, ECF subfamily